MISFPAWRWNFDVNRLTDVQRQLVEMMPSLVPGARLWIDGRSFQASSRAAVRVALHGAWFVEAWLASYGVPFSRGRCDDPGPLPGEVDLFASGQQLIEQAIASGELREHHARRSYDFQVVFGGYAKLRSPTFARYNPGAGKTKAARIAACATPGNIVVVGPAKARGAWKNQTPQISTSEAHILVPRSARRKKDEKLETYLQRMKDSGKRALVMVGVEVLGDYLEELQQVQPTVLIFDEIHYLSDSSTIRYLARSPGGLCPSCGATGSAPCDADCSGGKWAPKVTKASESKGGSRITRAAAAHELTRWPSIRHRIGIDGTPMYDGAPANIYMPLDLLMPDGWGKKRDFEIRYAEGHQGIFGWEAKGAANVDELKMRSSVFFHDVPRSVTHKNAPKFEFKVIWIPRNELSPPDEDALEMLRKAKGSKPKIREALRAIASSQKRDFVLKRVRDELEAGMKNVVFGARKEEVVRTGQKLIAMLKKRSIEASVFIGTGDDNDRDQMVEDFVAASVASLVGTGYAFGTSIDGLQCAHRGHLTEIPENPTDFEQWMGRLDRNSVDGTAVATTCYCYFASGTFDEAMVSAFTAKIGPIEQFIEETILTGMHGRMVGLEEMSAWMDSAAEKLVKTEFDRLMATFGEQED